MKGKVLGRFGGPVGDMFCDCWEVIGICLGGFGRVFGDVCRTLLGVTKTIKTYNDNI